MSTICHGSVKLVKWCEELKNIVNERWTEFYVIKTLNFILTWFIYKQELQ